MVMELLWDRGRVVTESSDKILCVAVTKFGELVVVDLTQWYAHSGKCILRGGRET